MPTHLLNGDGRKMNIQRDYLFVSICNEKLHRNYFVPLRIAHARAITEVQLNRLNKRLYRVLSPTDADIHWRRTIFVSTYSN